MALWVTEVSLDHKAKLVPLDHKDPEESLVAKGQEATKVTTLDVCGADNIFSVAIERISKI